MPEQERTEAPTPRRREEARKRGQVAKSLELNAALMLCAAFFALQFLGPGLCQELGSLTRYTFTELISSEVSIGSVQAYSLTLALTFLQMVGPLLLGLVAIALVSNLVQVGPVFSFQPLKPDLSRVNPSQGFSRIFSSRALLDFVKSLAKLAVMGGVVYWVISDNYRALLYLGHMELGEAVRLLGGVVLEIGIKAGVFLAAVAIADYIWQRRHLEQGLRMSREELKEELKHYEGDPYLRRRIRQQQRLLSMRRMMQSVPRADVVITNPTEIAVALQYDAKTMRAPRVVAKGVRLIAEQIRALAQEHRVPIVENKPLAQTLYKSVEVGREIPAILYQAVAEVLAFVYRMREAASRARSLQAEAPQGSHAI